MAVLSLIFSELSNFVAVTLTVRSFFKASCTFSVRVMNVFCFLFGQLVDDLCIALEYTYSAQEFCLFPGHRLL